MVVVRAVAMTLGIAAALTVGSSAAFSQGKPPHPAKPPHPSNSVRILLVTSPVARGSAASVFVQVSPPDASCTTVVLTKSGPVAAESLRPKRAANGLVRWTWKVAPGAPVGAARVFVECGSTIVRSKLTITS